MQFVKNAGIVLTDNMILAMDLNATDKVQLLAIKLAEDFRASFIGPLQEGFFEGNQFEKQAQEMVAKANSAGAKMANAFSSSFRKNNITKEVEKIITKFDKLVGNADKLTSAYDNVKKRFEDLSASHRKEVQDITEQISKLQNAIS